jgi:hypothetical protein
MGLSGKVRAGGARRREAPPAASPVSAEVAPAGDDTHSTRLRHAAITRNLTTWSSYKIWVEQMRDSWQPDGGMVAVTEAAGKAAKK